MKTAWLPLFVLTLSAEPSAREYEGRLLTPIASYSALGSPFDLRLTGPLDGEPDSALPAGTVVHGFIRRAHSIGLGLRRERAQLGLGFAGCELPGGAAVPCSVELVAVDNARESVDKGNRITGILAGSHPHSWFSGAWYRPAATRFNKSTLGLTGAGGMLHARIAPTPVGAGAVMMTRLILFRMPDPEIELPRGTELIVRVVSEPRPSPQHAIANLHSLSEALRDTPADIMTPERTRAADVINFAFEASQAAVVQAFEAAGWTVADALTARTAARMYKAFTSMLTYPRAPVSMLQYEGRPPDLVFQKSFNSLAKRHHIRLWRVTVGGQPVWLGAATHDVGIFIDWKAVRLMHRIDPAIDRERRKVINDLTESGCVDGAVSVERPSRMRDGSNGAAIVTDGALALLTLRPCTSIAEPPQPMGKPRRAAIVLVTRRLVMESRHYVTRGNPYYWAYRSGKSLIVRTWRR